LNKFYQILFVIIYPSLRLRIEELEYPEHQVSLEVTFENFRDVDVVYEQEILCELRGLILICLVITFELEVVCWGS
jgi:hypothetical protein